MSAPGLLATIEFIKKNLESSSSFHTTAHVFIIFTIETEYKPTKLIAALKTLLRPTT